MLKSKCDLIKNLAKIEASEVQLTKFKDKNRLILINQQCEKTKSMRNAKLQTIFQILEGSFQTTAI